MIKEQGDLSKGKLLFPKEGNSPSSSYAEGYLFDKEQTYYKDLEILDYFGKAEDWTEFKSLCQEANGSFRLVLQKGQEHWLALDHRASYHLYWYQQADGHYYIAPNGFDLLPYMQTKAWAASACAFFLNKGCTPLHKTLLQGLFTLPPATALRIDAEGFSLEAYEVLPTLNKDLESLSEEKALNLFQEHLDRATERLIRHLNGRKVVLSLTGGFDSRLIACQLKKHHYSNVLCISYGKDGNEDMRKAKLVADKLGFPFHYIPSVDLERLDDYRKDKEFLAYMHYMTGLSSSYFYQEFIPSRRIKGLLPAEDFILLTGHQGDGIGGSQVMDRDLLKGKALSLDELTDKLFEHKQRHQNFSAESEHLVKQEIKSSLENLEKRTAGAVAMNLFEGFISNEDYPKYILNSQHSWRYRGIETATLFTDKDLYNFAYSLPENLRFGKRLYDKMAMNIFADYDINFDDDLLLFDVLKNPYYRFKQLVKPFVKTLLPKSPNIFKADLIGFASIMQPLAEELAEDKRFAPTSINGLSFAWYLKHLEELLAIPLPRELF